MVEGIAGMPECQDPLSDYLAMSRHSGAKGGFKRNLWVAIHGELARTTVH